MAVTDVATLSTRGTGQARDQPLSWRRELLLLAFAYVAYLAVRFAVPDDMSLAQGRAMVVYEWELALNLAPELALNAAVSSLGVLAVFCSYAYATLHYVVTPAVLVWLYRRHPGHYRPARAVLVIGSAIAMVCYWLLPLAPPRLMPDLGFVDTMARWESYGWWDTAASVPGGLAGLSNQLAAMPSLHVGWALWAGWYLARLAPYRLLRWAGAIYPVFMTIVVIATGNHFLLDAVGGVAVILAGALLEPVVRRALSARRHAGAAARPLP